MELKTLLVDDQCRCILTWTDRVLLIPLSDKLICITTVKSDEREAAELRGRLFNPVLSSLQCWID